MTTNQKAAADKLAEAVRNFLDGSRSVLPVIAALNDYENTAGEVEAASQEPELNPEIYGSPAEVDAYIKHDLEAQKRSEEAAVDWIGNPGANIEIIAKPAPEAVTLEEVKEWISQCHHDGADEAMSFIRAAKAAILAERAKAKGVQS